MTLLQILFISAYIIDMIDSGKVARAAILGQQGGVWGVSEGYSVGTRVYVALNRKLIGSWKAITS